MPGLSRRRFLAASAATATAAGVGLSGRAAAESAGKRRRHKRHGDLRDIRHVMVVMQENRSFDHYFGTLRGVRGFGDRSTVTLPGGGSVFEQPVTGPDLPVTAIQYPWRLREAPVSKYPGWNRPPNSYLGAQWFSGLSHSWDDQHGAWQGGLMNGWVEAKLGVGTMGYLDRHDIPFHYALADAYTIGDAYHCSALSATGPNRTYLWGGTVDAAQKFSGFTAYNGGDELGRNLLWETYAESLQRAGVSWRVYQCLDNFEDNALQYFKIFADLDPTQGGRPEPGNPLYDNGIRAVPEPVTGIRGNADNLINAIRADVKTGRLPQVSWVVSNQAFSEHPAGAPNDGAYFVRGILEALHTDPEVFNSTLVVINYDENDGFFDHVPPPVAPPGTTDEWFSEPLGAGPSPLFGELGAVPVGLGFRVPLILVSPWTRGGWVTSEVADHTSILQFLEKWTEAIGKPARCDTISEWRRRVCGDLTRAFDFTAPVFGLPHLPRNTAIGDPPGGGYEPPPASNAMPLQERGTKRARPLPVQPNANLETVTINHLGKLEALISLSNNARHVAKASHFAVYNNAAAIKTFLDYPDNAPSQHTVDPVTSTATSTVRPLLDLGASEVPGEYDLTVIGPNRFLRHFTGNVLTGDTTSHVHASYYPDGLHHAPRLALRLSNHGNEPVTFTVRFNHYANRRPAEHRVPGGRHHTHTIHPLRTSHGWYDVTVSVSGDRSWTRRYVGHLEDGRPSTTGS